MAARTPKNKIGANKSAAEKPNQGRGRPTAYKPEYAVKATEACQRGATDIEVADMLGITDRTLYRWRHDYPEFCQALKSGKEFCDERVERSLYQKAIGYSFTTMERVGTGKNAKLAPIVKQVAPDTTAQIFWLKNRRSQQWRDRHEHTGADGGPLHIVVAKDDADLG